jgi:hypothetical protein
MMHDRYLSANPNKQPSRTEAYHWSRALSAFNKQLCRVPQGEEQTALLTTASLLGLLTFSQIEANTPEEAWPLAPPSGSDLTWLKMSDGKKEVFKLTQRSTAEASPLFKKLSYIYTEPLLPVSTASRERAVEGDVPAEIYSIYDLDPNSTSLADNTNPNPASPTAALKWAVSHLTQILSPSTPSTTILFAFLYMISAMRPDFKFLLETKEPRALVLLAWWYAKVSSLGLWWVERRVRLEGLAICLYLERRFREGERGGGEEEIEGEGMGGMRRLLEWPRAVFEGAGSRGGEGGDRYRTSIGV